MTKADEEDARHEKQWRIQRIGWIAMVVIVVAALTGLLGGGPLARARLESSVLRLEYQRFERVHAPTSIAMDLMDSGSGSDLVVWLDRAFLEAFEVRQIVPAARDQIAGEDGTTFRFAGGSLPGLRRIRFDLEPTRVGPVSAHVATVATEPLAFTPFVLP